MYNSILTKIICFVFSMNNSSYTVLASDSASGTNASFVPGINSDNDTVCAKCEGESEENNTLDTIVDSFVKDLNKDIEEILLGTADENNNNSDSNDILTKDHVESKVEMRSMGVSMTYPIYDMIEGTSYSSILNRPPTPRPLNKYNDTSEDEEYETNEDEEHETSEDEEYDTSENEEYEVGENEEYNTSNYSHNRGN